MGRLPLFLGVLLALLSPGNAAASCEPASSAEQEAQADAIVDGTVVDIATAGAQSTVTLDVDRVLKGAPGKVVVLEASLPGESIVGEVPFHEGWPHWRLYLREIEPGSGRYYTTLCDGTREIPPMQQSGSGSRQPAVEPPSPDTLGLRVAL